METVEKLERRMECIADESKSEVAKTRTSSIPGTIKNKVLHAKSAYI
jgi:hypothetical protein